MKDEVVLGDLKFPTAEINVAKPQGQVDEGQIKYSDVMEIDQNQMLVEGVAELKKHPQLESFLGKLNDLKNDFILKVGETSKDFELKGSVKVLFAVRRKES